MRDVTPLHKIHSLDKILENCQDTHLELLAQIKR